MVVPNHSLWTALLSIAMTITLSNGCAYTSITNAVVTNVSPPSPSQVQCTISETAAIGTSVCQLSVPGNPPVTLSNYGTPPITNFVELNSEYDADNDITVLSLTLTGSVDDYADASTTPLIGNLNCGSTPDLLIFLINRVNDQTPQFGSTSYELNGVTEGFHKGYDLLSSFNVTITATDADTEGDPSSIMDFSIISGNEDGTFSIGNTIASCSSSCTMQLMVVGTMDYQTHPQYKLTLQVQDEGTPSLFSTATLTITVQDVDNLDPKFDHTFYYADVTELNKGPYPLNLTPENIQAVDQDTGIDVPVVYYLIFDDCGASCDAERAAFSIDQTSGVITFNSDVDVSAIINREATFSVQATQVDNIDRSTLAFVTVYLPAPTAN